MARWRKNKMFPGTEHMEIGRGMTLTVEKSGSKWDGGFMERRAIGSPFPTRRQARAAAHQQAAHALRIALDELTER